MSTSSEEDDNFLRIHAKAIAQALQQQEALEQANKSGGPKNQSQKERLIHDTYVALCHDDPRVESDLACQYLATALLDPKSDYALSGPLVEGIRQLCAKQQEQGSTDEKPNKTNEETKNLTSNASSATPKGSAMLAWAIYARIPLLCCRAKAISDVHAYLGSYRPPPPPNPFEEETQKSTIHSPQKHQEADRLAEMLSQPPPREEANNDENNKNDLEEEVWAAESDPSDFEFESGFSYEQQMTDFQDTFAAWMIDRSDPMKLSKPPAEGTTWKQVRHAVMDLTAQLNYRQISSLWNNSDEGATAIKTLTGGRGATDHLSQFILTLLVPPSSTTSASQPSIFDSPDDEEDAIQPQRQLQSMAWYPLWVLRDAAATVSSSSAIFKQYLSLLQTLISIDAASSKAPTDNNKPMAPATYVGLASLSALCQRFVVDADNPTSGNNSSKTVERFRALRLSLWESADELSHALEQEERVAKAAATTDKASDWIVWTLLPLFEILTNQRLQTGTTIVAKAESMAQRHYQQQSSQQWSGLLQSGLFRHWMVRLQALKKGEDRQQEKQLLWHLMRRSLLYTIAQSMSATSALGKYAWRFPNFASLVEIGGEGSSKNIDLASFSEYLVDDVLWHLLSIELAGGAAASGPTIQWKSTAKRSTILKPLPTREECQRNSWNGFQSLCSYVVQVLDLACQEENKKENLQTTQEVKEGTKTKTEVTAEAGVEKGQYHVVLQSFHRFVDSVVACPLLVQLFVNKLELKSDDTKTIAKCLDGIHESLSQYKAPAPGASNSLKVKGEDGEGKTEEVDSKRTKEQVRDASLQEDIHTVRKGLKVLRSLLAAKTPPGSSPGAMIPLDVTSSSKTD